MVTDGDPGNRSASIVYRTALPPIRPCLEAFERLWPATWLVTGDDGSGGRWRDPHLWRFFIAWLGRCNRCREFQERLVLAGDREEASFRMVRGVVAEAPPGESVSAIELYHVIGPLTPEAVRRIEDLNRRLEIIKRETHGTSGSGQ